MVLHRRADVASPGPSLETYVETRFNLLTTAVEGKLRAHDMALLAFVDAQKTALEAAKAVAQAAFIAQDLRYQQRFEAQSDALAAAFLSQQTAMQCVAAETPVLCVDLVWRPASDLRVGDELIAFDEETSNRQGRRFRRAVVTANDVSTDVLLLVTTPRGAVRCNRNHPWLVRRPYKNARWRWIRAIDMVAGDEVLHALDVWEADRSWEAGWLAGMYDGEGSVRIVPTGVRLYLTQQEGTTAERVYNVIATRLGRAPCVQRTPAGKYQNRKMVCHFTINQRADVLKMLGTVRPTRLLLRSDEMWDGRYLCGTHRSSFVTSVEPAGKGLIASLSTSTKTYIAGGFAMHNTAFVVAEKAVQAALAAADRAVSKAELAADKRFESVNEFRKTLDDQQRTLMPRPEVNVMFGGLTDKIGALKEQMEGLLAERAGLRGGWGYAVGVVGFILALGSLIMIGVKFFQGG